MEREPIAIVGLTAIHPGSLDAKGFWNDVLSGRDLMTDVPSHYWLIEDFYDPNPQAPDKTYGRRGAFLQRIAFDALEFGIPPSALPATDAAQLLALIGAKRTLEDAARGRANHVPRERVSVILGVAGATSLALHTAGRLQRPAWVKGLRESGMPEEEVQAACDRIAANFTPLQENTFPGLLSNVVAGRIANRFDLGGSNFVVDAACAGSLAAVNVAINELHLQQSDMVLTGGVDAMNDVLMYMCFSKTPALSPTGDCRPFSDKADGTMLGEGLSMFALRRLSDAERDGDRIYAVIRGIGSSSDGRAKSVYAPHPKGQAVALRRAYEAAGVKPSTVELVEAHGTGTAAGDASEFESLRTVYEESQRPDRQWCALGSVKSQIGHSKSAAGAASLFKAAMALHHKVLPPTLKVDHPDPKLDIPDSPFYLNAQARPWVSNGEHPRRAAVSSFGFGGTNFHAVLEEYTATVPDSSFTVAPEELVVLSAPSARQLADRCREAAQGAKGVDGGRRVARQSQKSFDAHSPCRLAVVANAGELSQKLEKAAAQLQSGAAVSVPGVYHGEGKTPGKVAFLFAGQGSQYPNMGKDLAIHFAPALRAWDLAEKTLHLDAPRFHDAIFPKPVYSDEERAAQARKLTATDTAQPALAAAALAHLGLTRALGVQPDFVAGHSFGELPALYCAAAVSAEDLVRMARRRGSLMANASQPDGAMIAVSHAADALKELLQQWGSAVCIANHNSPRQTVLSGAAEAITEVEARLATAGISFRRLPVSTAFHSPLMNPAVEPFAAFLEEIAIAAPAIPVISNAGAAAYPADPAAIRRQLAEQIVRPVEFAQQVEELYARGVRTFVELGAGVVLTGLVSASLQGRAHLAVSLDRKDVHGVTALWHALAQLAAAGCELQFANLWPAFAAPAEIGAALSKGSTIQVDGAGYGRPYPPVGGAAGLPKPNPRRAVPAVAAPASTPAPLTVAAPAPAFAPAATHMEISPAPMVTPMTVPSSMLSEVQTQISEAQKSCHAAILESLSLTLKSLEALSQAVPATSAATSTPAQTMWQPAPVAPPDPIAASAVRVPVPEPQVVAAPVPASVGVIEQLLQIVAEKTGYPVEVLNVDADMESELGIDSIKRVEIFSAVQEQVPGLPEIKPESMATLRTLRQIGEFLDAGETVAPAVVEAKSSVNMIERLLQIVAEKTGYPVEVLNVDADMESELGIDSIKRVEIFSAVQEQVPGLPEIKPESMATLRTLRQIGEFLGAGETVAPAVVEAKSSVNTIERLLQIVAEKTGYPVEVLNIDADMESELGIDSIKRVEIFSAVQEQVPGLPEIKPESMATLRTLRQIGEFLGAGETVPPAPGLASRCPQQVVRTVESPAPGLPLPGIFSGTRIAVTPGMPGLAEALAARLESLGVRAEAVVEPASVDDGLICLEALQPVFDVDAAIALNRSAFRAVQTLVRSPEPKLLVTVQGLGGDFGLAGAQPLAAWAGGVSALAKTAAAELPAIAVKSLDLEIGAQTVEELAERILTELLTGGVQPEVGLYSDGQRVVLEAAALPADFTPLNLTALGKQPVLVVSGGARGVTARCMVELAGAIRPRIALLGRTALQQEPDFCQGVAGEAALKQAFSAHAKRSGQAIQLARISADVASILAAREVRATLDELKTAGADAMYVPTDLKSPAAVQSALQQVRAQWGPIHGIVHGAGVLADKQIALKTPEQFDRVFDTKVEGLRTLLDATANDPLRLICTFSSVAARYGNAGQSDYAMANEVLNKVAAAEARRRGPACVVHSLAWGPWDGGMVNPALAAHFASRGVDLIPLDDGARAFVEAILRPRPGVETVISAAGFPANPPSLKPESVDLVVNARTYPFLNGHRIQNEPVVPVVLVLEWFYRAASAFHPDKPVSACEDLRVLSGVVLNDFDGNGERLRLTCRVAENDATALRCELRNPESGRLHYSATLLTGDERHAAPALQVAQSAESAQDPYDGSLFHGPEFQVIRELDSLVEDGARARLTGTREMQWTAGPWKTEAAGLDGALQVLRLWTKEQLGELSLPTRIGRFVSYTEPTDEVIRCVARCRTVGKLRTVSDITLCGEDGRGLAALQEVEMHVTGEKETR